MTDIHSQHPGSTLAGTVLGNYRILEPLNRGGMGTVFRAEHTVLGRPAAVKILRPELTTNPQLVQRFLIEAKASTLIRHPGIVEVYDYGTTDDGMSYLVMELLQGSSLASRLGERGRLPEREVVSIARGIASALKAAHREGIVHRDLKPDNIFLVPDPDGPTGERVKVLDFGIAKLIDPKRSHQTQTGALIGTPIYMAPEQARAASAIDHRADLYSLGCLMYQMIAGRPPFVAAGAGELIAMHLFNAPQPPSAVAPVSPELERIVLRLLEKEPAARFQDGGEVIDALDPLLGSSARGGAPAAVPLSLADERRLDEKEPKSAMGIVAGVITVGLAAAIGLFIATRGGGGGDEPTAGSGSASGAAPTDVAPPASEPPKPSPVPAPTPKEPSPSPSPSPTATPTPTPAERPADRPAGRPVDPRPATPTPARPTRPTTGSTGTRGKPAGEKPNGSGPVTHPDGPVTRPDSGPVTRPSGGPVTSPSSGPVSPGGSPINTPDSLNEDKKPAPPPPKPAEPPPPPPPPTDKLPDKPGAGAS